MESTLQNVHRANYIVKTTFPTKTLHGKNCYPKNRFSKTLLAKTRLAMQVISIQTSSPTTIIAKPPSDWRFDPRGFTQKTISPLGEFFLKYTQRHPLRKQNTTFRCQ